MTIAVLAEFTVPAASVPAIRAALPGMLAFTRSEPGCARYDVAEDVEHPGVFRVSEEWDSREALQAHLATPEMADWLAVRRALGMSARKVRVFGVSGFEDL